MRRAYDEGGQDVVRSGEPAAHAAQDDAHRHCDGNVCGGGERIERQGDGMEVEQGIAEAFDVRAYRTVCYITWRALDSAVENNKAIILTDTKCCEELFFK